MGESKWYGGSKASEIKYHGSATIQPNPGGTKGGWGRLSGAIESANEKLYLHAYLRNDAQRGLFSYDIGQTWGPEIHIPHKAISVNLAAMICVRISVFRQWMISRDAACGWKLQAVAR